MRSKKASVPFIFITILLDATGLGLIIPVLPDVIRRFSSDPNFVNQYYGYFVAVYALMQLFASPVLGSLSDRFGRRPVLLVSLLGASLDYVLMAYAPDLTILFIGRVIAGLTGASMTVASSYMADVSDDSNRSANFGMIGAAWGAGFIVGPLLGGVLGIHGTHAPFLAAAALNGLNFIFGLFVLPESLPAEKRRSISFARLNPFASIYKVITTSPVVHMIAVFFLLFLAGQAHPSIWVLYTQYKFAWTAFEVGLSLTVVGVTVAVVQGGLTRVLIPKVGERNALHIGMFFCVFGYACYALATAGWMMYVILFFGSISGIAMPVLQSEITKSTPANEQGELQGSLMSLGSITAILGPIIYTESFARYTSDSGTFKFPGMPYMIAAALCIVAWVLIVVKQKKQPLQEPL